MPLPLDTTTEQRILFSPGPGETWILLCSCGNNEVSRDRHGWTRFHPDFDQNRCRCLACGPEAALDYHADAYRHYRAG
ncbi:hypothetical protein [Halomonas koreensis]|uniref:Zinc-ribbon domain-containing protein n=1 Tax=Halomonas koreensis TaxID=245385 RepID=A0ABU1G3C3_9GAMM|nr:hypothetical protein [Halomonas koreensis]MDR5867411.1 hypothetical protein [Halomonas koreensis]